MKLSELFGKTFGFVSDVNTITDIARGLLGKSAPEVGETSMKKAWFGGIFSDVDEVELSKLVIRMRRTKNYGPDALELWTEFMNTKFPKGNTFPERAANFQTRNRFIQFIVHHGRDRAAPTKVEETVSKKKDGTETTTIKWGPAKQDRTDALVRLKECVDIMRHAITVGKTRAEAFEVLLKHLDSLNAPTPSDALGNTLEAAIKNYQKTARAAEQWLEAEITAMDNDKSWFGRFSNWLDRKGL